MMMKNKRGIATIFLLAVVVLILLGIYIVLYLPLPVFSKIRSLLHYIMIIIVWVSLQIGLIYGYYRLAIYTRQGISIYKRKVQIWTFKVKNFLLSRA
jgi:hypothetical protein